MTDQDDSRSTAPTAARQDYWDYSLHSLGAHVGREKRTFIAVAVLGTALALAYALTVQRYYSASTVLLPPQQQQSSTLGALAQLGALSGMAGAAAGIKPPDELYVALLKTRRLQDAVIRRLKLQDRYEQTSLENTRKRLGALVAVSSDRKTGLVTVETDDVDAAFAAQLAQVHFEELKKILSNLAVTEAQQRRVFFEQQVARTREALAAAEVAFRSAQAKSGLVVSQALAESGIREGATLRARIAEREVQLHALGRFATEQNPEVRRVSAELSALRDQLSRLEGGDAGAGANTPPQGMEAVRAYREMKVQEASLEALIRQYEVARVDESREGPLLQQVDPPVVPERPTKPKRKSLVLAGFAASVLAGLVLALLKARWRPRRG